MDESFFSENFSSLETLNDKIPGNFTTNLLEKQKIEGHMANQIFKKN